MYMSGRKFMGEVHTGHWDRHAARATARRAWSSRRADGACELHTRTVGTQLTRVPRPSMRSRRKSPLRSGSSIPADQNYKTAAGLSVKDLELHCQQLQACSA